MTEAIVAFLLAIWGTLTEMAPYLLFGFFFAGVLSIVIRPELVEQHLGGRGISQVVKAAIFGVPLPLCSCGVIPVAASLRRHGAGTGATTSFLISTPQTGVDSIMVTFSLLGPVFAIFRPLVSFVSGIFGGSLVNIFNRSGSTDEQYRPTCVGECCTGCEEGNRFVRVLRYGFVTLPKDINRALIIGIVVAGVISTVVPDDYFAGVLGGGILSMLVMMAAGIPVYVCATASVPIAAALIAKGISPGAALVFLMTGPATNAATVSTVWKTMGRRTAGIYLATVAGSAILFGLLLDFIYTERGTSAVSSMPWMVPGPVKIASAVLLLAVVIASFFHSSKVGEQAMSNKTEKRLGITIEGMSCDHCAQSIRRALMETPGVESAVVDYRKGEAVVTGRDFDVSRLQQAIEELGYTFIKSEPLEE
ncbi:MAG: SO_0444 family Cu/Zn efflux transporter [bacterium]|nr:MAG: SO_0444 family Cu/Zn efflux transporter [bacterium]